MGVERGYGEGRSLGWTAAPDCKQQSQQTVHSPGGPVLRGSPLHLASFQVPVAELGMETVK